MRSGDLCAVELEWAGLRPLVSDSLPVVGPSRNLYVAMDRHGRDDGQPPSRLELANLILDGLESEIIRPFLPARLLRSGQPGRYQLFVANPRGGHDAP